MGMIKKALRITAGAFVGFILVCVFIAAIAPDTPEPQGNVTETPKLNVPNSPAMSTVQDSEWISMAYVDSGVVLDAGTQLGNDLQTVETYGFQPSLNSANAMYVAAGSAVTKSESMTVSSDLLPAKEDYELGMAYSRTSAYYIYEGLTAGSYGRYSEGKTKLETGMANMNWASESFTDFSEHMKVYNANH